MATIVIKDLPDSMELDRQAMTSITGGGRTSGRPSGVRRTIYREDRVFNYPGAQTRKQTNNGSAAGRKTN